MSKLPSTPTVSIHDDRRWYEESDETLTDYVDLLVLGGITDFYVSCYGFLGGTIGWTSNNTPLGVSGLVHTNRIADLITLCNAVGIRVHGTVHTCRSTGCPTLYPFAPNSADQKHVDTRTQTGINGAVGLPWLTFITNLIIDLTSISGMQGVLLDFTHDDNYIDYPEPENLVQMELVIKTIYEGIKAVNPNTLITSWGNPWYDFNHPDIPRAGRDQIGWANKGYLDFITAGEYGGYWSWQNEPTSIQIGAEGFGDGVRGNPPIMDWIYNARALITNGTEIVLMAITYDNKLPAPPPTGLARDKWIAVLDNMRYEKHINFYTAQLLTDDQWYQLGEHRRKYGWRR